MKIFIYRFKEAPFPCDAIFTCEEVKGNSKLEVRRKLWKILASQHLDGEKKSTWTVSLEKDLEGNQVHVVRSYTLPLRHQRLKLPYRPRGKKASF